MKKIYQTRFGNDGNCFPACIASLLEVPLGEVPDINWNGSDNHDERHNWHEDIDVYLEKKHGLGLLFISHGQPKGNYIVSGTTKRNPKLNHAMIYSGGQLVHDPMPDISDSDSEIVDFLDITVLIRLNTPKDKETK